MFFGYVIVLQSNQRGAAIKHDISRNKVDASLEGMAFLDTFWLHSCLFAIVLTSLSTYACLMQRIDLKLLMHLLK